MEAVRENVEAGSVRAAPAKLSCSCCGNSELRLRRVLWPSLIREWELAPAEVAYIDRQQGLTCTRCGCNLRSMALAHALLMHFEVAGVFQDFVASPAAAGLRVLEINEAGMLSQFLRRLPQHTLIRYPDSDMTQLAFAERSFDVVVHSDTLEHVPDPIAGLSECRRVLSKNGICAYTVPIVVDRLTRSRRGLPPSYHGTPQNPGDHLVHTEYGADAWKDALLAGFSECRIIAKEYPAGQALVAVRHD
jgi:SAM-dependent methyltransferase